MFFSSDDKGFANAWRTYNDQFFSVEFWHSVSFTIPLIALVFAIVIIGYSEIDAITKQNEVLNNGSKKQ